MFYHFYESNRMQYAIFTPKYFIDTITPFTLDEYDFLIYQRKLYVVGTQKNCLDEKVLLSTQNT